MDLIFNFDLQVNRDLLRQLDRLDQPVQLVRKGRLAIQDPVDVLDLVVRLEQAVEMAKQVCEHLIIVAVVVWALVVHTRNIPDVPLNLVDMLENIRNNLMIHNLCFRTTWSNRCGASGPVGPFWTNWSEWRSWSNWITRTCWSSRQRRTSWSYGSQWTNMRDWSSGRSRPGGSLRKYRWGLKYLIK